MRHLFVKALFLSFLIHWTVLGVFVFTFPVFPESFRPMLVFLGSVLKQQDFHVDVGWKRDSRGAVSSDNSRDVLLIDGVDGPVVPPQARTPRLFFREGESKPVFSPASGVQGKVTLKSTFDLSSPDDRPQAEAAGDNLTKYEAGAYKPLRLPH